MVAQGTKREWRWLGVVVTAALLALILPGVRAWFYVINEWEIVESTPYEVIEPTLNRIQSDISNFGRFRPLFWLVWHTQRTLIQDNVLIWHVSVAAIGVVTFLLMFDGLRRIIPAPFAALSLVLLMFYPQAGSIWYNLIYQETVGTLLVVLAGYAAIRGAHSGGRGWDALFAISAIACGFMKENYALLLPALMGGRFTLQLAFERPLKTAFPSLLAVGLFFAALMAIIGTIFLRASYGYGQVIVSDRPPALDALARILLPVGLLVPVLIAAVSYGRRRPLLVLLAGGTLIMWIIPQIVLYNELIRERFLYPAIIGSAAGTGIALAVLRPLRWRWLVWGAWALTVIPFIGNLPGQWIAASNFAASTENMRAAVMELAAMDVSTIVVQIDPQQNYDQYEAAYSITLFLRHEGYSGQLVLHHPPTVPMEQLIGYVDNGYYDAVNAENPAAPTAFLLLTPETTWIITDVCRVDPCPETMLETTE